MYVKRFLQLFVVFFIAILLSELVVFGLGIKTLFWTIIVVSVLGYILLVIPLVVMTIRKAKEKNANDASNNQFGLVLAKLPNKITLAYVNNTKVYNSIVTFKQSKTAENVLYVVTPKDTSRAEKIATGDTVAISSWFVEATGLRFSSNNVVVDKLTDEQLKAELVAQPEIKSLNENAENMLVIKLTLKSVLIESFRDNPKTIEW
ncbi:hypothetical protein WOSG25_090800 [Weissella oryzae SG25]|uniref:Uncharacterized protein n=1 Tax=Weissella oryzae (strain DSM 25784 / JCM 18191 / LMG 30913 / SG25) TaxID=1329250 RepID=A0A069CVH6_WEIOS|nr:hypothetical protein [Weissella oryzae]GAK31382.1 hypothetical protein WOSG25_090800 [Weissella oryzae SG25]